MKILGWYSTIILGLLIGIFIRDYCNHKRKSLIRAGVLTIPIMTYVIYTLIKV